MSIAPWLLRAVFLCLASGCGRIGYEIFDAAGLDSSLTGMDAAQGDGAIGMDASQMDGAIDMDAAGLDGGFDATPGSDAGPPIDCPFWETGWTFNPLREQSTLDTTTGRDGAPVLGMDTLSIVFASERGAGLDIYRSARANILSLWIAPTRVDELSMTGTTEERLAFAPGDLVGYLVSDRAGGGGGSTDIWVATRSTRTSAFGAPTPTTGLNTFGGEHDVFVTASGTAVYFTRENAGGTPHIFSARRDSDSSFSGVVAHPELDSALGEASPWLTPDELVIVFAADRPEGAGHVDIWYATRSSTAVAFGPVQPLPSVNAAGNDTDPMLTADGCMLVFASDRAGSLDVYQSLAVAP